MTRLSVNINKIATLRNARGGNVPNVVEAAINIEKFGAHGITVHPRPDERHIKYTDVVELKKVVTTEFNIEGYPDERFIRLVSEVLPTQVTLVPDLPSQVTSNTGWDAVANKAILTEMVAYFKKLGIRTSVFVGTEIEQIEAAASTGTDRIELYTEPYATYFYADKVAAIQPFVQAAKRATELGIELNAGHDLDLHNLHYFVEAIPNIKEVSIGHALISDALYFGLQDTVKKYLDCLK